MNEMMIAQKEKENKRKSMTTTVIAHIALVILALLPLLTYPDPPPGQEGIMVNLGIPDIGQGEENAGPSEPAVSEPEEAQPEPTPPQPEPQEPTPPVKADPQPAQRDVVQTEDPNAVALRKKQEQERREREAAEAERQRQQEEARRKAAAEAEAKRKADEEARKKAEADRFGKSLGLEGLGSGKGNTGKAGNQGDPGGDPNADRLEGISKGSGRVGGGLGSRGVLASPSVSENSQKSGTVVIEVCVNSDGSVISSDLKLQGTTTQDPQLVEAARRNARQWRFSKGEVEKQCGTITYNFKVQ